MSSETELSEGVFESFYTMRLSVDALICASELVPVGGEDESLGYLFRLLAYQVKADLDAHFRMLAMPVKSASRPQADILI